VVPDRAQLPKCAYIQYAFCRSELVLYGCAIAARLDVWTAKAISITAYWLILPDLNFCQFAMFYYCFFLIQQISVFNRWINTAASVVSPALQ